MELTLWPVIREYWEIIVHLEDLELESARRSGGLGWEKRVFVLMGVGIESIDGRWMIEF